MGKMISKFITGSLRPEAPPSNHEESERFDRPTPSRIHEPIHEESERQRAPLFTINRLKEAVDTTLDRFLSLQKDDGHWIFELEADTTIPAEYVLLQRFLGRPIKDSLKNKLIAYLISKQQPDGGWPLFTNSHGDISAAVKSYFALKVLGVGPNEPHMVKARRFIISMGGAVRVNVFTRITLALFGQIPWRTTPAMPIEIMLLPKWFFFTLSKVSYWSRTVIVPLLILYAKRPVCKLEPHEGVRELFVNPPESLVNIDTFVPGRSYKNVFIALDRLLKLVEPLMSRVWREKAEQLALIWTRRRMVGEGGIGAIFPAMANAVMALKTLGYPESDPDFARGIKAIDDLFVEHADYAYCQPCLSPVWDTCLSLSALMEASLPTDHEAVQKAVKWLLEKQIFIDGDWRQKVPKLEPGGWAFQYENNLYPDVDDTPMVLMAILRAGYFDRAEYKVNFEKAVNWILGMQSSDGGWGAFDIDNNYLYLNEIPFADHGALLDPSTSDLTGRCIELLAMLGYDKSFPPIARGVRFLKREQEASGAWFGRWGVNYIYGTWSALMGLARVGEDMSQPYIKKAAQWLKSRQNPDDGWGETCYSYNDPTLAGKGESTPSQTAWALLGLMAAGEVNSYAVQRGISYLLRTQDDRGAWNEELYTGTGFPRVFFLRYHGYSQFFPLWALGVYSRLRLGLKTRQEEMSLDRPAELRLPILK